MEKKIILAIDVGTGMVKVLAGRQATDGSVELLGSGAAPTAGYARGVVTDINALAHSIRQAVDCVVMATDCQTIGSIYLGISGSMLGSQSSIGTVALASPGVVTEADVERACKAAVFAVANDEYQVLHVLPAKEIAAQAGSALEVKTHIVAASKTLLQNLTGTLSATGIHLTGIVAGGIIAAQGMQNELPGQPSNYIFIDIGAGSADISVYAGGCLCASSVLPLGGDYITSDLMQGLSVGRAHAEEIKRYYSRLSTNLRNQGVVLDCNDYGTTDKHIPFDFLYDIIESRVDEIITLVYEELKPLLDQYFSDQGQAIQSVYLTGGCGAMPSTVARAAEVFQIHAEAVKPERLAVEYVHPANTVCYGIIKHGVQVAASEMVTERSAWNVFVHKARRLLNF